MHVFNQTPLMAAAWMGNVEVIKLGADTEKIDGNGLTAFQIALAQSDRSDAYAKKKLADIYDLLIIDRLSPVYKPNKIAGTTMLKKGMLLCKELLKQLIAAKTGESS